MWLSRFPRFLRGAGYEKTQILYWILVGGPGSGRENRQFAPGKKIQQEYGFTSGTVNREGKGVSWRGMCSRKGCGSAAVW